MRGRCGGLAWRDTDYGKPVHELLQERVAYTERLLLRIILCLHKLEQCISYFCKLEQFYELFLVTAGHNPNAAHKNPALP